MNSVSIHKNFVTLNLKGIYSVKMYILESGVTNTI